MADKQVGDRVGPYQLTAVLGEGAAGKVFRAAWDPTDEQRADAPADHPPEIALKLLRPEVAANEDVFHRFVREIGVAQQIHHPHILRHVDSGLADDYLYYAMEIASYGSLRDVLQKRYTLPWRDAVESARHVADALGALHGQGVIHRDLKPENVFLTEEGALKLGDFGLSRRDDGPALTVSGQTVGSIRFMAPEQVRGRRDLDGRCDLYALGCLLFHMVAGRPPFPSMDTMTVFRQHVEEPPPKLRSVAPTAPSSLEALVDRLLAKDRDDRPPSAQSVSETLERLLESEDGEIDSIEASLSLGTIVPIEPFPDDEEDDPGDLSGGPVEAGMVGGAFDDDDNDDDDSELEDDIPAGLAQRLAAGAGDQPQKKGCASVLLFVATGLVALSAVVATLTW